MKERGFLVSQHEAKALQDGRQTQFRRVIKPQPFLGDKFQNYEPQVGRCPYGQAGDRLWVRETFCHKVDPITAVVSYNEFWYRASNPEVMKVDGDGGWVFRKDGCEASPWLPSIHMTRRESRFTREITNIKVEKVQEISEEDAVVEGVRRVFFQGVPWFYHTESGGPSFETAIEAYAALWDSIHGEGAWARDGWTWVLSTCSL